MNKKHKIWQSHLPGKPLGVAVVQDKTNPKDKGDIGFAIRFWKRAMKDAGVIEELKERKHFIKKSQKRRVQMENAKYFQQINSQEE
jgi:ribosomal protein S21|tara:strand:- start:271 stop:528 length:258 start_codon:yes stop_codon:yes gene_type:complete